MYPIFCCYLADRFLFFYYLHYYLCFDFRRIVLLFLVLHLTFFSSKPTNFCLKSQDYYSIEIVIWFAPDQRSSKREMSQWMTMQVSNAPDWSKIWHRWVVKKLKMVNIDMTLLCVINYFDAHMNC